jgi:hypothetical protein
VVLLRNTRKIEFRILPWNFAQREALMRIVYWESFRSFDSFYSEIRTSKSGSVYKQCRKHSFTIALSRIGAIKRPETFTIDYSH